MVQIVINMHLNSIRRLAAEIMKAGKNKIRFKPNKTVEASAAITRSDIKNLIKDGVVYKIQNSGRRKKEKKRRRGSGHKRGKRDKAGKKDWMKQLRAQRKYLKQIILNGEIEKKQKRKLYLKIKSGIFKSKKVFYKYLEDNKLLIKRSENV